jgi:hypothetical protein
LRNVVLRSELALAVVSEFGGCFSDARFGFEDFDFGELAATFEFRVRPFCAGFVLRLGAGDDLESRRAARVATVDGAVEILRVPGSLIGGR